MLTQARLVSLGSFRLSGLWIWLEFRRQDCQGYSRGVLFLLPSYFKSHFTHIRLAPAAVTTEISTADKVYRCASIENIAIFESAKPLTVHLWTGPFAKAFNLDCLCVSPSGQGRGYGAAIVRWGIERAEEQGMPTSVVAAHEKDPFYGKLGFKEMGRADVGPLAGKVVGGAVMFRGRGKN
jgi:N-acetylglutamate synthase-like GNAT family acetyltransferase